MKLKTIIILSVANRTFQNTTAAKNKRFRLFGTLI